jgi:ribosomal-protein-alanine N-acetyltransferase
MKNTKQKNSLIYIKEIVMIKDIYEECPTYKKKIITLRQTKIEDFQELLKCYSDDKAVSLFNSDNCNGDDFYYNTGERMKQAIDFWNFAYKNKEFIRWTIILNNTNEKVGTIEMFHKVGDDEFNHFGILRIDLRSNYETQPVIDDILEIVKENFYRVFNVKAIVTKAIPNATERITSLVQKGYKPFNRKPMIYDDYFINKQNSISE